MSATRTRVSCSAASSGSCERPPVTARDLARFLELLFDREEREEDDAAEGEGAEAGQAEEQPDPISLDSC